MMLLHALAGGLGAVTRFLVDTLVARHNPFQVPLGTLVINVSGSLLLGILTGLVTSSDPASAAVTAKAVVGPGFCGGYTTFSTASVESVRLWLAEGATTGIRYAAVTLLGSVAAAAAGLALGSFALSW
jgi:CrcB protein